MSRGSLGRAGRTRLGATIAIIVAAAGTLSACGGSDAPAGTGGDGTGNTNSITVLRSTGATFEPLYIAEEQGYFKEAGLNVTIKPGAADTSQNAPSIVNGEAQFAMTDSPGFLKAAASKLPVQIVSALQVATRKTPPSDGLMVKPDSPIKSFADIGGKTIAVAALGGSVQFVTEYAAKQAGVDPSTIKFVALPLNGLVDAVKNGQVDAAHTFASFFDAAKAQGLTAIGEGTNIVPGLPQSVLFADRTWLAANAAAAKKFTDAVAKAVTYANSHPDDVRAIDVKYTTMAPEYIKNRQIQIYSAEVDKGVVSMIIKEMLGFGLLKVAPDESTIYWDQMLTTTRSE
ncbi:ABC transporter substrate-binding protein [Acrocarpospora sp. B8E8]|uniref:ABC transporter substrate-binding protein n=1 Tax=Acrocarpospora sp. B8E8 TaxID=3153572 RepID=UPI00325D2C19